MTSLNYRLAVGRPTGSLSRLFIVNTGTIYLVIAKYITFFLVSNISKFGEDFDYPFDHRESLHFWHVFDTLSKTNLGFTFHFI